MSFNVFSPDGHAVELWSLPNKQGSGPIHHELVRDHAQWDKFLPSSHHPGRPLYHTVAQLREGTSRSKEAVEAVHFIWAEIDEKDHLDLTREEIRRRINAMPIKPTLVIFSGHGWHLYWRLNEAENATLGEGQKTV